MQIDIITLFPEMFTPFCTMGVIGRAQQSRKINIIFTNPRQFAAPPHRIVDDKPYGGGPGMVLQAKPIIDAIDHIAPTNPTAHRIYLTPRGQLFTDATARQLAQYNNHQPTQPRGLVLLCGRYRGIDERAIEYFNGTEISVGNYILSGGEVAAMAIIDAVARYIPGVLGNQDSTSQEALVDGLLDAPCYTRPETIRDKTVPAVLLAGDHQAIKKWRDEQRLQTTQNKRPDLLTKSSGRKQ